MSGDRLEQMFLLQDAFMRRLAKHQQDFPREWPLDMTQKDSQVECKNLVGDIIMELSEVVRELKNSKKHRQTNVQDFDRSKLVEEAVDAFKFFLELLIFVGVTPQEFFESYVAKDRVINERLDNKY